ncbi:MAG TPA: hypothetical protein VGS19_27565 [Streptosporangiaceae bacterium]|nr:hypothetical protein [Streptosporangiaceae bacterium]
MHRQQLGLAEPMTSTGLMAADEAARLSRADPPRLTATPKMPWSANERLAAVPGDTAE